MRAIGMIRIVGPIRQRCVVNTDHSSKFYRLPLRSAVVASRMSAPCRFPMGRRRHGFAAYGVHPGLSVVDGSRPPDRRAFIRRLPRDRATDRYFPSVLRSASDGSPVCHRCCILQLAVIGGNGTPQLYRGHFGRCGNFFARVAKRKLGHCENQIGPQGDKTGQH
jgi:hypothetical protein